MKNTPECPVASALCPLQSSSLSLYGVYYVDMILKMQWYSGCIIFGSYKKMFFIIYCPIFHNFSASEMWHIITATNNILYDAVISDER